jgi:hypothetical protein
MAFNISRCSMTKITVKIESSKCSHCGKFFESASSESFYSIKLHKYPEQVEIAQRKLLPGAFHFCSDSCMFKRDVGILTVEKIYLLTENLRHPATKVSTPPAIALNHLRSLRKSRPV